MIDTVDPNAKVAEKEVTHSVSTAEPWQHRMSWGAILAGVVVALLMQLAFEILGVAIGVGVVEPGEDTLGPDFGTSVAVWLAGSALLSLFIGGLVTGKLSAATDAFDGALEAVVMMGLFTFVSLFVLTTSLSATLRGVSNVIGDGLSFIGANVEDVSTTVASAVELRDGTLDEIRAEAEEILAPGASLTSLRLAVDDYLLNDEPGNDLRQATIEALTTQTELTEQEAVAQLDEWEREFRQTVDAFEAEAEQVADEIDDIVAATAGLIFMLLVAGIFAAGAGGYVAASENAHAEIARRKTIREQTTAVVT